MNAPAQSESLLQIIGTIAGILSVCVTAIVSFLVLRIQRDMALLKNQILEGINGKYISRNEHEILCKNHEEMMHEIKDHALEARKRHHELHEQFIACQSAHGVKIK